MKWFSKKPSTTEQCIINSKNQINNNPTSTLPPGTQAPDFTLPSTTGDRISLSQHRGSPVILTFYPADWSQVCGDQLVLYNEVLPIFKEFNAVLLAISVDSTWSHKEFAKQRNLNFPLLSDFEPKGEVSRLYGVYNQKKGTSQRALFVVDSKGIIHWNYVSPDDINPGADGILRALESIKN
jgi:peroxiredoxin (alkyl hydroperoxide reductase subunit C)